MFPMVFPSEMPVSRMVPVHASSCSSKAPAPNLCQAELYKSHSPIQGLLSYRKGRGRSSCLPPLKIR